MKKFLVVTNNAQKLKDLDLKAREAGTRAVAVSSSGSLYLWGDGKPVKTNSDDVASILGVEVEEVIKWVESKGQYEMIDTEEPTIGQAELPHVEPVFEISNEDEVYEDVEDILSEDETDYDEPVHDELMYQLLGELVNVQKEANAKIEKILEVLESNILA